MKHHQVRLVRHAYKTELCTRLLCNFKNLLIPRPSIQALESFSFRDFYVIRRLVEIEDPILGTLRIVVQLQLYGFGEGLTNPIKR